jgi:uncharacterized protein GlcG (DUF336 family)
MKKQTWLERKQIGFFAMALLVAVSALVFSNSAAWAQGNTPITLAKATISPTMAKRTMMQNTINAETARALVDACIAWVKAHPAAITLNIIVMSPSGQVIDSHAMDGLMPIGSEATMQKAKTVLFTRQPSHVLEARFQKDLAGLVSRRDFGKEQGLAFYDVGGGFPIIVEGQMIGVLAVGGGAGDASLPDSLAAHEALTKVIGPQPPLVIPGVH